MKNKILLSLLTSCMISGVAMADMYVGVEYGAAKNKTTMDDGSSSFTGDNDYSDVKLKIGTGDDGGIKGQMTLSFVSFDEAIFDNKNSDLVELGFDVIKEFEVTKEFYPFIKAGFGVGSMSVEGYSESSIREVSFNVGAGVSYKVVDHLYLIAGVDYVGRKWQDIEYQSGWSTVTVSTTESGVKPYVGVNYRF